MHHYTAIIRWENPSPGFTTGKYSREHSWSFDGGVTVPASASPSVVPAPFSNPAHVDPEEAYVATVASCHMLTFLHLASKSGYAVERYTDEARGEMTKNERGAFWVSRIELHPNVVYSSDKRPQQADEEHLHEQAHEQCFIANSIKTVVVVTGV